MVKPGNLVDLTWNLTSSLMLSLFSILVLIDSELKCNPVQICITVRQIDKRIWYYPAVSVKSVRFGRVCKQP